MKRCIIDNLKSRRWSPDSNNRVSGKPGAVHSECSQHIGGKIECSFDSLLDNPLLVLIQARFNSHRLPGKVLRSLHGRPMLRWVVDRVSDSSLVTRILVATSTEVSDDPIYNFCKNENIRCARGPLENVAMRLSQIARREGELAFARVSADSPVIDPKIIDQAIVLYNTNDCDLVTNVFPRSFPKGQSIEVIKLKSMRHLLHGGATDEELEHVTKYFYSNPENFKICNFSSGEKYSDARLTVDTAMDLHLMEQLLRRCRGNPGGWEELAKLCWEESGD